MSEIARLEQTLTDLHAQQKALKAQKRAVAEELEQLRTAELLTKDLGLSDKGVQTLRQVIGARGVESQEAIGRIGA